MIKVKAEVAALGAQSLIDVIKTVRAIDMRLSLS
jgi:hypothetical protein